jgi:hypothetical protein
MLPDTEPTPEGNLIYPDSHGGTNLNSPVFDPQTKLLYVSARESGAYIIKCRPRVNFPDFGGGNCTTNYITYETGGKQFVLFAAGNTFAAFSLP